MEGKSRSLRYSKVCTWYSVVKLILLNKTHDQSLEDRCVIDLAAESACLKMLMHCMYKWSCQLWPPDYFVFLLWGIRFSLALWAQRTNETSVARVRVGGRRREVGCICLKSSCRGGRGVCEVGGGGNKNGISIWILSTLRRNISEAAIVTSRIQTKGVLGTWIDVKMTAFSTGGTIIMKGNISFMSLQFNMATRRVYKTLSPSIFFSYSCSFHTMYSLCLEQIWMLCKW